MRSRYSAFAVGADAYLIRTWHPTTRPAKLRLDPAQRWTGLRIVGTTGGGLLDVEGTVEFHADHDHRGRPGTLHECSRFVRHNGLWYYLGPIA